MAAASAASEGFVGAPDALPLDKAAASGSGSGGGGDRVVDCGVCAICLDKIALQETALVKGCDHAYWYLVGNSPISPPPEPLNKTHTLGLHFALGLRFLSSRLIRVFVVSADHV